MIKSFLPLGIDTQELQIEAQRMPGVPGLSFTGMPDASLRDSKEKIYALLQEFCPTRKVEKLLVHFINENPILNGTHLELPIFLAIYAAFQNSLPLERIRQFRFSGRLTLGGNIFSTQACLFEKKRLGDQHICAADYTNLFELLEDFHEGFPQKRLTSLGAPHSLFTSTSSPIHVEGLESQRYWLWLTSLIREPAFLLGPPGAGKTLLTRWIHQQLPHPSAQEEAEISAIWTRSGQRREEGSIPLQAPHSRTQLSEFRGSRKSNVFQPGYWILAHKGVLVLNEYPEFPRDCRETLRVVLDEKFVDTNFQGQWIRWPANFWLLMTANPCPCGNTLLTSTRGCKCSASLRQAYQSQMSGPILDRCALKLWIPKDEENKNVITLKLPDQTTRMNIRTQWLEKHNELPKINLENFTLFQRLSRRSRHLKQKLGNTLFQCKLLEGHNETSAQRETLLALEHRILEEASLFST